MGWKSAAALTALALVILAGGFTIAQDKTTKNSKREEERQEIDRLINDMAQAFDKRDAAAIAAHWTKNGEFIHNDGEPLHGQAEIQNGYVEFFKTLKGRPRLEVQPVAVCFPSADMAVADVALQLQNDDGAIMASGRQSIVAVREEGRWKAALCREWDHGISLNIGLKDLEWLIGTWQAVANDREVTITYEWNESHTFIRGKFAVKEGSKVIDSGTEIIGKDHADGLLRSWVFQSDGGFGGGVWNRDGKKWSVDVHGVRNDGSRVSATIIYVQVDRDTVTWQAVNAASDGVTVADVSPIKVTRQK